jgi:acetoin utilization deacetylase AcuC-like enzyme
VIVVQCGADSLFGDPIDLKNQFNVSTSGYCDCIGLVIEKAIPAIFLGGGGYNFANTARLWCSITGMLARKKLTRDIPEHNDFLSYGPSYELASSAGTNTPNKNTAEYATAILSRCLDNLDLLNARE